MFDIRRIQEQAIYKAVEKFGGENTAKKIVYGANEEAREENNGTWVNATMKRLEDSFAPTVTKQIRMECQCGYGMEEKVALLRELRASYSDLEEMANSDKAKTAGLFSENDSLYLQFTFCPCPMLGEVEQLDSKTWCQCTTGYSKVLFERAFECKADVELLESIKSGDNRCLMKIVLNKTSQADII